MTLLPLPPSLTCLVRSSTQSRQCPRRWYQQNYHTWYISRRYCQGKYPSTTLLFAPHGRRGWGCNTSTHDLSGEIRSRPLPLFNVERLANNRRPRTYPFSSLYRNPAKAIEHRNRFVGAKNCQTRPSNVTPENNRSKNIGKESPRFGLRE